MSILDLLLTLLYPPRCSSCGRDLRRLLQPSLCRACIAELGTIGAACARCGEPGETSPCVQCRRSPPPFRHARACFRYREGGLSSSLVWRWKYGRDHVLGRSLSGLFAAQRRLESECYDVVVPVPLHDSRLAGRGFNQAVLLARAALLPNERLAPRALRRTNRTSSQTSLGRRARLGNVRAAFTVADPGALRGRTVLLVDDVLTTGATVRECATVLRAAGAAVVDVWTLARTPRLRVPAPPPGDVSMAPRLVPAGVTEEAP